MRIQRGSLAHSLWIALLPTHEEADLNSVWFEVDRVIDEMEGGAGTP